MALRGQRFELDPEADEFTANVLPEFAVSDQSAGFVVKEIEERSATSVPQPPKLKTARRGFPEHKKRSYVSTFRQQHAAKGPESKGQKNNTQPPEISTQVLPSDRAIALHVGKKYGFDPEAVDKAEISTENKRRIAEMSAEDVQDAKADLMTNLSPEFIQQLLRRAKIHDPQSPSIQVPEDGEDTLGHTIAEQEQKQKQAQTANGLQETSESTPETTTDLAPTQQSNPSIHFPSPPQPVSTYTALDPSSPSFLTDLKSHYFPSTPHEPSTLSWLQDPSPDENTDYDPSNPSYAPSAIRFNFAGRLIPPKESLEIDVSRGLHHHGHSPQAAGYTVPELGLLCRSTLPNQRCMAFQLLGRVLYRLGRGDFGPRGSDLCDGLWDVVEHERVVEVMLHEANRDSTHISVKAYATDALWLWRQGGRGDRGLRKKGEKMAV